MANQDRAKKCLLMDGFWDFNFFFKFLQSLYQLVMKNLSNVGVFFCIPLPYKHTVSPRFNRSVSANENSKSCNVSLLKITEIKNNELSIDTVDDETSSFATCSDAEQYGNIGYQVFSREESKIRKSFGLNSRYLKEIIEFCE